VTLGAGDYEITAAAPGLATPAKSVTVKTGAPTDVDLALALSAVRESVVVSDAQGEVPLSRTTESVTVIERAQLDLAQIHSVSDALRSVPGFHVVSPGRSAR
jgi:outer membrane cobalamin receptor